MSQSFLTPALLFTLALVPSTVRAQDADAGTIVVTATRTPQPLDRISTAVTVLDRATLTRLQTPAVADLLATTPGITVARNGGLGTVTTLRIRGADSDQTMVLIDGVKLNDPSAPGAGFNFADQLTGQIDRIEVLRGPQSVLWGSQAIGGVVNLITAPPTPHWQLRASGEGGSYGTGAVSASASGTLGPVGLSLGSSYLRTDGISAFNRSRGGVEADGYRNLAARARATVALGAALGLDLRASFTRGTAERDGFPAPRFALADTPESSRTETFVGYAGATLRQWDGRLRHRLGFGYTDTDRADFNPAATPRQTFAAVGRNERLDYQLGVDLGEAVQLTAGAEREVSRLRTASRRASARLTSGYAQLLATPWPALTLIAGARHDDHSSAGGTTTLAAGAAFSLNEGATRLRANIGEGFKAPSLFQLDDSAFGFGNPALQPERALGWDAGIEQRWLDDRLAFSATVYGRRTSNQIDFISCFQVSRPLCAGRPFGTYDNILRTRAHGLELTLALQPVEGLTVDAQYSYTDARNRTPGSPDFGKRLARRAVHTAGVRADYVAPGGWSIGASLTHIGDSFDNAANTSRIDGHVVADLRAAVPLGAHWSLYGRVTNLFDEAYETTLFYGSPGRALTLGLRAGF